MFKELFKGNQNIKVKFSTEEELLDIIPHPASSHKHMPEWFRKLKPIVKGSTLAEPKSAKKCVPVLDAINQGYTIPLWCDLYITVGKRIECFDDNNVKISEIMDNGILDSEIIGATVATGKPPVSKVKRDNKLVVNVKMSLEKIRDNDSMDGHLWEQVGELCDLKKFKFGKRILKFGNPWSIKTPKGWSVQFKNPANNWSNNIHILEGVVDTDEYFTPVNFPFVWTGSEEGEWIIPKGTPLIQVIPFKRIDTDIEVGIYNPRKEGELTNKLLTKYFDRYKTYCWHKRKK